MVHVWGRQWPVSSPMVRGVAVVGALTLGLSGCVDPSSQLATTPPADDPLVETMPLSDDEVEEDIPVVEIVFDTIEECLQGNWQINNDAFGDFFARTDERVVNINVAGLATMTIEDDTYRMFFDNWAIQYDTGDPTFLISRDGSETVQFVITADNVMEVAQADDQINLELFSIIGGGDGEGIAIATSDPGPLPLDGATLQCTGSALEVFVEQESFLFDRL